MTQPTPAEQLLNLADRAERHGGLTPTEAARLREGVAHHCARADEAERRLTNLRSSYTTVIGMFSSAAERAIENGKRAEQAEAERDEARMWARHGYEIGQRSCTWTDHGVAPAWLTEPAESAALDEHQEQPLRAPDGTPICTCTYGKRCPACRD